MKKTTPSMIKQQRLIYYLQPALLLKHNIHVFTVHLLYSTLFKLYIRSKLPNRIPIQYRVLALAYPTHGSKSMNVNGKCSLTGVVDGRDIVCWKIKYCVRQCFRDNSIIVFVFVGRKIAVFRLLVFVLSFVYMCSFNDLDYFASLLVYKWQIITGYVH